MASAVAMFVTVTGTIYLGGIFGMWTAFFRGLGLVDPSQTEGAIATFKAMTTDQGAFWLTTTLGKLAMIGLAAQALTLTGRIKGWAVACIFVGAVLFLLFWDLDNWMMIATLLMLAGFFPVRRALLVKKRKARYPLKPNDRLNGAPEPSVVAHEELLFIHIRRDGHVEEADHHLFVGLAAPT